MDIVKYAKAFEDKYAAAYLLNDPAHRESHFREVQDNMFQIMEDLDTGTTGMLGKHMAVAAAYLHDLFAWSRVNHHLLSHEYVSTGECELLDIFSTEERQLVALACLEHRASFKGEFTSKFSAAFNAADLGPPDLMNDVARAYKYSLATVLDQTPEAAVQAAVDHMVDKFGRNGYARRSSAYVAAYGTQLEEYFTAIESLHSQHLTPDLFE